MSGTSKWEEGQKINYDKKNLKSVQKYSMKKIYPFLSLHFSPSISRIILNGRNNNKNKGEFGNRRKIALPWKMKKKSFNDKKGNTTWKKKKKK